MYEFHGNKDSRRQREIKEPLTIYRAGGFLFISCRRYQTDHLQIYSGGVRILNVQLGLADNDIYQSAVSEDAKKAVEDAKEKLLAGEVTVDSAYGMDEATLKGIINGAQ